MNIQRTSNGLLTRTLGEITCYGRTFRELKQNWYAQACEDVDRHLPIRKCFVGWKYRSKWFLFRRYAENARCDEVVSVLQPNNIYVRGR